MKNLLNKWIARGVNAFTHRFTTRSLAVLGLPRLLKPLVSRTVRAVNQKVQWTNTALWRQRYADCRRIMREVQTERSKVSPVYRFQGGSERVKPFVSGETVRGGHRNSKQSKFDSSTIALAGLGFVVVASIAGPALAKQIHYVDPLNPPSPKSSPNPFQLK